MVGDGHRFLHEGEIDLAARSYKGTMFEDK